MRKNFWRGEMTHKEIWNALDEMAAAQNLSCSGLAKQSGLSSTTFNKSKRYTRDGKARWVSLQSLAKVLDALGMDLAYFAGFVDRQKNNASAQ